MREWLSEDDLAYHVSDLVDGLDLKAFYAPHEGDGRRNSPYELRMMVKVLIYAYVTGGVFVEKESRVSCTGMWRFGWLGVGNFPKHRTSCEFRRRHLEVVGLARELGLVRLGKLSIDGSKVRANGSKRKAMSCGTHG